MVDGPDLEFCFQQVELWPRRKNRVHLDVATSDLDNEVERLVVLGVTKREAFAEHVWMLDPEGNDFCVVFRSAQDRGSDG